MATPAPVLNKIAISPTPASVLSEAGISPPVPDPARTALADRERERVLAAVEFGAALEDLVAHSQLQRNEPDDESRASGPRFPPDLMHRRSPEAFFLGTCQKLLKLEPTLLSIEQPGDGTGSPGPPSAPVLPSQELGIQQEVNALLQDHARSPDALNDAIIRWDDDIIELIVDFPAVLNGYKVGKALSLTHWRIWAAKHPAPGDAPSPVPWGEVFDEQRVGEIQRYLGILETVPDPRVPQAATVVATGLGYWRNALLTRIKDTPSVPTASGAQGTIDVPSRDDEDLTVALEEQIANWLDLLSGRREPESFPVVGILTTLTEGLTANWWARIIRFAIPFAAIMLLVLAVTIAVVAMIVYVDSPDEGSLAGGAVGTVGAGLSGIFTLLIARGRALFSRGAETADRLRERVDALEGRLKDQLDRAEKASEQVTAALGLRRVSLQDLGRDVLTNVAEQIRLEELNLAVSEPLVRFVLTRDRKDTKGNPLEEAKRFLKLVYGNRSNLDRLLPVFKGLYRFYRTAPPR